MKMSRTLDSHGVLEIVIDNQEKRNALDDEMIGYLIEQLQTRARLTILRSVGKYFCAGRDIANIDPDDDQSMQPLRALALAFRNASQPILAIVQGPAIGLGVSIACWSDLCLSSTEARFAIPEGRIGIAPTITAASLLEIVGRKRCLDMCLTARSLTAAQAHDYGIVQYLATPDRIHDAKRDIVDRVLQAAPEALALSRSLINSLHEDAFHNHLELAARQALVSARSATAAEGLKAFREKQSPSWVPREPA